MVENHGSLSAASATVPTGGTTVAFLPEACVTVSYCAPPVSFGSRFRDLTWGLVHLRIAQSLIRDAGRSKAVGELREVRNVLEKLKMCASMVDAEDVIGDIKDHVSDASVVAGLEKEM
jgi:hypothetical protein